MEIPIVIIAAYLLATLANYCADILPRKFKFSRPECTKCNSTLSWVSFFSYSRCSSCRSFRPIRHWLILVLMVIAEIWMWISPPPRLGFFVGTGFLFYFIVVFLIDLENRYILGITNLIGIIIGLAFGWYRNGLIDTLIGGAAGFLIMLIFYYLGIVFNRVVSRMRHQEVEEVALGFGDVYISGIIGLMIGWPEIVGALLVGILIGGLVSGLIIFGSMIFRKYQALTAIPYAPFLIIGGMLYLFIAKA